MLKVIGQEKRNQLSEGKYRGRSVFSQIARVPKCREFLMALKGAHDQDKGRRMIRDISLYLDSKQSFSVVDYGKVFRDAFAHGRLASASKDIGQTQVVKICTVVAEHLLYIMNHEFEAALRGKLTRS